MKKVTGISNKGEIKLKRKIDINDSLLKKILTSKQLNKLSFMLKKDTADLKSGKLKFYSANEVIEKMKNNLERSIL